MEIAFLIIESFTYWSSLLLVANKILNCSIRKKAFIIFVLLIYSPFVFIGIKFEYATFIYTNMIIQLIQIICTKFLAKNIRITAIIETYILIYCINMILVMALSCIMQFSDFALLIVDFIVNLVTYIFCVGCCINNKISIKIRQTLSVLPAGIKILTVVSFAISALVMSLIVANPLLSENTLWNVAIRIALVFLALFVCTTFPVLLITVLTNSYLKKQNEIFRQDLEAQADHYTALAKSNYELRRFRHDFNNIRIGLIKSLDDNDYQTALNILKNGQNSIYEATESIVQYDTGNGIVDAILTDKQAKARGNHIMINFEGSVPPTVLSPVDSCVIFGNTIDNAVDACEKMPPESEKIISVSSQCNSGFIFITITNPVSEDVIIENNTIDTTKKDRSLHGYGLYSLNETVKKYDGELKLLSKDNIFTVNIDLCINKKIS